jgi:anaerobic selenocysteine-containing dehydrogenase
MAEHVAQVTCPLCEATCGLDVTIDAGRVGAVRGDAEDVFSHGFICPKGASLAALHDDPDRLRAPLVRRGGELVETGWDEAFAEVEHRLAPIVAEHGPDAVAVYLGNPSAHNVAATLYGRALLKAIGTRNVYSASTVDQMPKQLAAGFLFGHPLTIAVPDLDRTEHLLILGANPLVSNGSLMTSPDVRGRLRAIRARGGKVVVVDPIRSRTAEQADEHHFIRPGTDALLLFALVQVLFADGLVRPGRLTEHLAGVAEVGALAAPFTPEAVAPATGIAADAIRRMARELAAAGSAAVYGRIGTTTQEFGTLASWLVDVLNALTGNLDREGGAMFPLAAAGQANASARPPRPFTVGRWASRVRGMPETLGELPVACLAEEIETPGEGRVRALVTVAGNPASSTPNSARLTKALGSLEFLLSLDVYVNETSRHADVILPGPTALERPHYDVALYQFAVRNVANYTPPAMPPPAGMPTDVDTLLRLIGIAGGQGADADLGKLDDLVAAGLAQRQLAAAGEVLAGYQVADALAALAPRRGVERLLDLMLRTGPYGDAFGARPGGLTLAALEAAPHGVDLGPLRPRIPEVLGTPSGKVELAPPAIVADVPRLAAALARPVAGGMLLIGRRQLRSNNSWMHNLPPLVGGTNRCTAQLHPEDAARLGLVDGQPVRVRSRTGEIEVPVELTEAIMPGVVSIPHGFGHDLSGVRLSVAAATGGANSNIVADEELLDPLSGNAVLNGIPVELAPA